MKANEPGDKAMEKVLMTTDDVKKVIPHRAPMLLVDNVVQMEPEQSITTTWHIDPEEKSSKGISLAIRCFRVSIRLRIWHRPRIS